ncbi:MAG: DUF72 domain-containing protein [Gemmatimonadaceae bacterium]
MGDAAIRIGTAGWTIPRACAREFPAEGSSLARYASRFTAAEINSSFHRPHRPESYRRWADSVPADFRFAVTQPGSARKAMISFWGHRWLASSLTRRAFPKRPCPADGAD